MTEFKERVLRAAQSYIALGWHVFPIHTMLDVEGDDKQVCSCGTDRCPDAGKHPTIKRWQKESSKDPVKILEWFGPDAAPANIGIVTGELSGITILDIDISPGHAGAETWAEIVSEHGEPDTLTAQTGSGGSHLVFRYNSVLKTASNVLGKGIDCRNDSGYIVAPPSRHRSGGVYEWLNWPDDSEPVLLNLPAHLSRRKEGRGRPRKGDLTKQKFSIEQVKSMLDVIPPDDRDLWRNVGIILGRAFNRIDEAWELYNEWSAKWGGRPGRNHGEIMHEAFYELSQQKTDSELSLGTIVRLAIENGWSPKFGEVPHENFIYFGPGNNFIYRPTGSYWVAEAVNFACSPVNEKGDLKQPATWLRQNMLATSITSDPALDGDYIKGTDCRDGMLVEQSGSAVFNTYRGPVIELGDPRLAGPFLDHVKRVFPKEGDAEQFLNYMAHRAQKPWEKPRFALLIAGDQGVGKDTAVEFCCPAIGSWNVSNIEPSALDANFNEYAAATLVRVSEAANLHDMNKWAFNERLKVLIAGSPDTLSINPKFGHKYSIRMYCGVIITTNHLTTGIYIPPDDRRYDVIDAANKAAMGLGDDEKVKEYFSELWGWFLGSGGDRHVAAYLMEKDISGWSAANGQRKTQAHRYVVATCTKNDDWFFDALEAIGEPEVFRSDALWAAVTKDGANVKEMATKLPHALVRADFRVHINPNRKDGRWKYENKYVTIYAKMSLTFEEIEKIRPHLTVPF